MQIESVECKKKKKKKKNQWSMPAKRDVNLEACLRCLPKNVSL